MDVVNYPCRCISFVRYKRTHEIRNFATFDACMHHSVTFVFPGRFDCDFKCVNLDHNLGIDIFQVFKETLPWHESRRVSIIASQYLFRYWHGVVRQQDISRTAIDRDFQRHMVSLGHKELNSHNRSYSIISINSMAAVMESPHGFPGSKVLAWLQVIDVPFCWMKFASTAKCVVAPICATNTVKPVYNDHLMGYFSAFWSSSRWPRAT